MSMLRNNIFEIILMVIAVILAQRLPSSDGDSKKYGRRFSPWSHGVQHFESLAPNDPSALFDELDKHKTIKSFPKWHHLMKIDETNLKEKKNENADDAIEVDQSQQLLLPLTLSAASNDMRQEEQRRRHFERLQNEAADREFEQIMRKLKLKMQRERENETVLKSVHKKDQQYKNYLKFCKKNKGKKLKQTTITTTKSPSSISTTSFTPPTHFPTTSRKPSYCENSQEAQMTPEEVERLLKIAMAMKSRALLILKNLNFLEMELLSRWPDEQNETQTTINVPEPLSSTRTKDLPERLEKPTTPRPKSYNGRFHFGLRALDGIKANMAAAMREQRKLEQKVREEYQMQLERAEWQRHQLQRLKCNRKRARFDAAPPAAVRLELMTTPASNIVENTKVLQKQPYAKQSSAAIKRLAYKVRMFADRNHIDLTRQPLYSWNMMRKCKRKGTNKLAPEAFALSN